MKKFIKTLTDRGRGLFVALSALFMLTLVPSLARADAISDAISSFDTTNIFAAGAAIIGLVIAIVGIRAVVKLLRGAA